MTHDDEQYGSWMPARRSDVEVTDMPDGLVVFDPLSHTAHHLNAPAALVWELIDGRTADAIDEAVAVVLEIEPSVAHGHASTTLAQLRAQGLIS